GGGGGGAQPGVWQERPAESAPPAPRPQGGAAGGRPGAGGQGGAAQGMGAISQEDLFAIIRAAGILGGGGRGFGGGAPTAEPGDYRVSMTIEGQTYTQTLRVERMAGGASSGFPFEVEEMEKAFSRWMRTQR
ncbi:MAG TPA: hypothetical protein PK788_07625, partial [Gemmatimonadaceae bacterium]|nr:hypothetical protein [Gemmatimonadaceae bacterium]